MLAAPRRPTAINVSSRRDLFVAYGISHPIPAAMPLASVLVAENPQTGPMIMAGDKRLGE
jgi:hypothetical protein